MIRVIFVIVALHLCVLPATHASIYGESAEFKDLQDQRTFSLSPDTSSGGLSGYWPYSFTISWDISYDLDAMLWHYEYNLSVSKKDISHFILEVADRAQDVDIKDVFINGNSATLEDPQSWTRAGNQRLPHSFYGIKFDNGGTSVSYSFYSEGDPVWGNFYVKGGVDKGNPINAYNSGLGMNNYDSDDKLDFIVRPNGAQAPPVAPEPLSSTLFIVGGTTLAFIRFRKKCSK